MVCLQAAPANAMQHDAITANPLDRVDFSANRAMVIERSSHRTRWPLTRSPKSAPPGCGQRADADGKPLPAHPVYTLMVEFAANTGLHRSELARVLVWPKVLEMATHLG